MLNKPALILLLSLLISSEKSFAQKFSLGIIGGASSSQISGDGIHGFAQFGGLFGADVEYKLNELWSLSMGMQFNQKGARNYKSKSVYSAYRLRTNYLEMPIILHYKIEQFKIHAGMYLGAKINHKERNSFGPIDPVREFNTLELGFQLGVNYRLNTDWQVELRFQNSILPVRAHELNQVYPPSWFILGEWHQEILNKGQYFTSLSLVFRYNL